MTDTTEVNVESNSSNLEPSLPDATVNSITPSIQQENPASENTNSTAGTATTQPALEGHSPKPQTASDQASSDNTTPVSEPPPSCSINLQFLDSHGWPIAKLGYRVLDISNKIRGDTRPSDPSNGNIKLIASGHTDAKGNAARLEGLTLGMRLEFQIKNDQGMYKLAAIDTVKGTEGNACLRSPKDKFTITTYSHDGIPRKAENIKAELAKKHSQTKSTEPNISINADKNIKPTVGNKENNSQGNPIISIKDGLSNMWGQNRNKVDAPFNSKTDLEKVNKLIAFATAQAATIDSGDISATIIKKMKDGTYKNAGAKESNGYKHSIHHCAKYVKIALWAAGYSVTSDGDIDSHIGCAKDLGPALLRNSFVEVSSKLPDARWAAPGDIIVYEDKTDPDRAGHIDIRTYDGYISDFIETYLPVRRFRVTGIYRKYHDPMPEKRMRAFLKALALQEANTIFERDGYAESYRTLPGAPYTNKFDSFKTHPFAEKVASNTASGAYGITTVFWKENLQKLDLSENAELFCPLAQDRLVIADIESKPSAEIARNHGVTALGLIRKGEIESAIKLINTRWASLPGGSQPRVVDKKTGRKLSLDDFLDFYNCYLKEML